MTDFPQQHRASGVHGPEGADFVMRPSGSQYWQEPTTSPTADTQSPHSLPEEPGSRTFMDELGEAMRFDPTILDKLKKQYPERAEELDSTLVWGGPHEGWLMRADQPNVATDLGAQEGYVKFDLTQGIITFGGTNQRTTNAAAGLAERALDHHVEAARYNPNGTTALVRPPQQLAAAPARPNLPTPKPNPTDTAKTKTQPSNTQNTSNGTRQDTPTPKKGSKKAERTNSRRRFVMPAAIVVAVVGSTYGCSQDFKDGFVDASGSKHPWQDIGNAVTFIPKKLPIIGGLL